MMSDFENLKNAEIEIARLKNSITLLTKGYRFNRVSKQIKKLSLDQDAAAMNYLKMHNTNYFELTEKNLDLLVNDKIEFLAKSEGWGVLASYEKTFKGSVHD